MSNNTNKSMQARWNLVVSKIGVPAEKIAIHQRFFLPLGNGKFAYCLKEAATFEARKDPIVTIYCLDSEDTSELSPGHLKFLLPETVVFPARKKHKPRKKK